jgi:hypothetical protein
MSKKPVDMSPIENELKGSLFFQRQSEPKTAEPEAEQPQAAQPKPTPIASGSVVSRHHATTVSRPHEAMSPAVNPEQLETIRQAVRQVGKEAATYRFTQQEKKALSDIVHTYKGSGIRTSENEITRIAVNHLVEDYRQNGANSILARVLARLNQ